MNLPMTMTYSMLLTATAIAFSPSTAIAQTVTILPEHSTMTSPAILAGKPGVPGRRVGGGSR